MTTAPHNEVAELRGRFRQVVGESTPPEAWLAMLLGEIGPAAEWCSLIRFADGEDRAQAARYTRSLLAKGAATMLEAVASLEVAEGLDGPLEQPLSHAEAAALLDRLRTSARGGDG